MIRKGVSKRLFSVLTFPVLAVIFGVSGGVFGGIGAASAAETEAAASGVCQVPRTKTSLSAYLPRVAERLASGLPVRIVALGSSSTAGAGASAPDRTYPARLAHYLHQWAGAVEVSVLNKGINGETDDQTVERIGSDVLAQNADLLIWQVGANTALRDGDVALSERSVRRGVDQAQAAGLDIVLMDLQYAPRMLAVQGRTDAMLAQIAHVAADEHVGLFQRFAVMRDLVENQRMTIGQLIGPDGVHQSDAGYDCVARTLAAGIEDAVRPQQGRAD